jgi:hypothetical protein
MWPWIKHLRDWAMRDFWPLHRTGPQPQALHCSYEKAGLTLDSQPIPWNAEAVLVEALVRLPASAGRRKGDFLLHLPEKKAPFPPEQMRREDADDRWRLFFRLPVPSHTTAAELVWRSSRSLGQITLPVLSQAEFINRLSLEMPTLAVRLGEQTVACQTFVSTQCQGLIAHAMLTSPTSLVPLADLGLRVEFRSERGGAIQNLPVQLSSTQLKARQAMVTVVPRKPRRIGTWTATWMLAEIPLATQRIRTISRQHFYRSLRVCETRFVLQGKAGDMTVARQLPPLDGLDRVGPCFLVSSREQGMAGLCQFQVRAQVTGAVQVPLLNEQEVLISDGPTPVVPGTVDIAELAQMNGFELRVNNTPLGALPLSPAPTASFTTEGGFKATGDFLWSPAAEDQLNERLGRLTDGPGNGY